MKPLFAIDDSPKKKRLWLLATLPFFVITIFMGLIAQVYVPGQFVSLPAILLALFGLAMPSRFPETKWIRGYFIFAEVVALCTVTLEAYWILGGCKLAGKCV